MTSPLDSLNLNTPDGRAFARSCLHDQHLRHDFDTLETVAREGGQIAFETALDVRKRLAADTLAPTWLRKHAEETVEFLREEQRPFAHECRSRSWQLDGYAICRAPAGHEGGHVWEVQ